MKRIKVLAIVLAVLMLFSVVQVFAAQVDIKETQAKSGSYTYEEFSDGTVCITDYSGSATSLIMPDTLGGKTVTAIAYDVFWGCTNLVSVDLPDSLVIIGNSAFRNCKSLKTIVVPDTLETIGDYAFSFCESLTSIDLPDTVNSIGAYAFECCKNLSSADLGKGLQSMGEFAFYKTKLDKITIPGSLKTIGEHAFRFCGELTSVEIGYGVECIGRGAFNECVGLTNVSIPNSVKTICETAFADCDSLENIVLPESLECIEMIAFLDCPNLSSVYIPSSVNSIGWRAFAMCGSLDRIEVDKNNPTYDSRDNCNAIIETATSTLIGGCNTTIIPNSIVAIGDYAFQGAYELKEVTIPYSVNSIEKDSFEQPIIIHGFESSYAQTYAKSKGYTFVPIEITAIKGIALKNDVKTLTLEVGEIYSPEFEIYPENANEPFNLTSKNDVVSASGNAIVAKKVGKTTVTVTTLSGVSYAFDVVVNEPSEMNITTTPKKTSYNINETIDLSGMVVKVTYSDGVIKTVTDYTVEGFNSKTEGIKTLTVKWVSENAVVFTDAFDVSIVDPNKIVEFEIVKTPTKTAYNLYDDLDLSGMQVQVVYNNGIKEYADDYTVSGFDNKKVGTQSITISKVSTTGERFTDTFDVTVKRVEVYIAELPDKIVYDKREELDLTGLVVKGEYADGTHREITEYTTESNFNVLAEGEYTVTVNAEYSTVTFNVYVYEGGTMPSVPETEPTEVVTEVTTVTSPTIVVIVPTTTVEPSETIPYSSTMVEPTEEPTTKATDPSESSTLSTEPSTEVTEKPSEPTIVTEPEEDGVLGDVNGDGKVNIKDATAIQKHIANLMSLTDEGYALADVTQDTKVNIKDATAIQKHIAGIETGLPIGKLKPMYN